MVAKNRRNRYLPQQFVVLLLLALLPTWQLPLLAADTNNDSTPLAQIYLPMIAGNEAAGGDNEQVQAATNAGTAIALFRTFSGRLDYMAIGAAQTSSGTSCDNLGARTATLSLPTGSTVQAAYLYWATSTLNANNGDTTVTLNSKVVNAQKTWGESFYNSFLSNHNYSGARADVTSLVSGSGNYTVGDLTYYTGNPQCSARMILGAWSLVVIYANPALSPQIVNLYDGFVGQFSGANGLSTTTTQNNLLPINLPSGCTQSVQLTHVTYEGDTTPGEYLSINGNNLGDNTYSGSTAPGLDIDTYNLSTMVPGGASNLTVSTQNYRVYSLLNWAQESYINNAYLVKYMLCDNDGDGVGDSSDLDDDNDGMLDSYEGNGALDSDGDAIPDSRDLDSDNDGINDVREANGLDANNDALADGTVTAQGVPTSAANGAGITSPDTDSDAVRNWRDLDSDNDGLDETREVNSPDTNSDGFADGTDSDGDGIRDSVDGKAGFGDANDPLLPDTDRDGKPDPYDIDSDNDSIPDLLESDNGWLDGDRDARADGGDADNDGIVNGLDHSDAYGDAIDPYAPDTDGDGKRDPYDSDSDDDGIPDRIEAQPTTSNLPPSGRDSDGDGLDDAYDLRP